MVPVSDLENPLYPWKNGPKVPEPYTERVMEDNGVHRLLEDKPMYIPRYTSYIIRRALKAWEHIPNQVDLKVICDYYFRLHLMEETYDERRRMLSREGEGFSPPPEYSSIATPSIPLSINPELKRRTFSQVVKQPPTYTQNNHSLNAHQLPNPTSNTYYPVTFQGSNSSAVPCSLSTSHQSSIQSTLPSSHDSSFQWSPLRSLPNLNQFSHTLPQFSSISGSYLSSHQSAKCSFPISHSPYPECPPASALPTPQLTSLVTYSQVIPQETMFPVFYSQVTYPLVSMYGYCAQTNTGHSSFQNGGQFSANVPSNPITSILVESSNSTLEEAMASSLNISATLALDEASASFENSTSSAKEPSQTSLLVLQSSSGIDKTNDSNQEEAKSIWITDGTSKNVKCTTGVEPKLKNDSATSSETQSTEAVTPKIQLHIPKLQMNAVAPGLRRSSSDTGISKTCFESTDSESGLTGKDGLPEDQWMFSSSDNEFLRSRGISLRHGKSNNFSESKGFRPNLSIN